MAETQGGRLFRDGADAVAYNGHFERYSKEKLTVDKMREFVGNEMPEMNKVFYGWKTSTVTRKASSLKVFVEKIEKAKIKAWVLDGHSLESLEKLHTDKFKDQYLRLRALQQAKFKQDGIKKLRLYRGTDGTRTGPRMKREIIDICDKLREAGKEWKKQDIEYIENSLIGYSRSRKIADEFGKNVGGITVSRSVPVEDIVIDWDEIFSHLKDAREKEVIILGRKQKIKLGSFSWEE